LPNWLVINPQCISQTYYDIKPQDEYSHMATQTSEASIIDL